MRVQILTRADVSAKGPPVIFSATVSKYSMVQTRAQAKLQAGTPKAVVVQKAKNATSTAVSQAMNQVKLVSPAGSPKPKSPLVKATKASAKKIVSAKLSATTSPSKAGVAAAVGAAAAQAITHHVTASPAHLETSGGNIVAVADVASKASKKGKSEARKRMKGVKKIKAGAKHSPKHRHRIVLKGKLHATTYRSRVRPGVYRKHKKSSRTSRYAIRKKWLTGAQQRASSLMSSWGRLI